MTRNRRMALVLALAAAASLSAGYAVWHVTPPSPEASLVAVGRSDLEPLSRSDAGNAKDDTTNDDSSAITRIPPSFPKTVDQAKAEAAAAKKPPVKWSAADIAGAKARCDAILRRIHAVAIPHQPIKEGACGAPAPIELLSIGENPQVALSPPAIVTCPLAEGLATWLEQNLQPLAQKKFQSPIITIRTMSSYSCRNAYGRKQTKISEHGFANALDIRGFVTASARPATVLADWGTPQREIALRIAAEKEAARVAAASKAAPAITATAASNQVRATTETSATPAGAPSTGVASTTIVVSIPKLSAILPGTTPPANAAALSIAEPDRLGGPTPPDGAAIKPRKIIPPRPETNPDRHRAEREFLREAHASACKIFGTTLGPEANAAHRNHIHVDMAARPTMKICE